MRAYYNEIDEKALAWLIELARDGHIPRGHFDGRSIHDVRPSELAQYDQCHFFAGIGGWPYALKLAGWPDDIPIWTGSCPCQPFSAAGKQKGTTDERHLWPEFLRLIAECMPAVVFGEQVASPLGREWLAGVRADLEALGYEVGSADLCAAGINAPHIRQRLWWVAFARGFGRRGQGDGSSEGAARRLAAQVETQGLRANGGLDDATDGRARGKIQAISCENWKKNRLPWEASQFITCRDGKSRRIPVEPSLFPLAHGIPGRVGLLRGAGNAIVPQVAVAFIEASIEAIIDRINQQEKEIHNANR